MYLAIESSASTTFVAVGDEKRSFEKRSEISLEAKGSEYLHILARQVISDAGIRWNDINGIIVGAGPGSFTGLRLGVAFAQGIALALKIPCVGVSSFEGWVREFLDGTSAVVTVANAQRGEFFARVFSPDGVPLSSSEIIPGSSMLDWVGKFNLDSPKFVGFVDDLPIGGGVVAKPNNAASGLLVVGADRVMASSYDLLAISGLTPEYLRAVSARTIAERAQK